jgi:hypothetical protein
MQRLPNSEHALTNNIVRQCVQVITAITEQYSDHPAVVAITPLNEPLPITPKDILKQFYWDAYMIVRSNAPHWVFVMYVLAPVSTCASCDSSIHKPGLVDTGTMRSLSRSKLGQGSSMDVPFMLLTYTCIR